MSEKYIFKKLLHSLLHNISAKMQWFFKVKRYIWYMNKALTTN